MTQGGCLHPVHSSGAAHIPARDGGRAFPADYLSDAQDPGGDSFVARHGAGVFSACLQHRRPCGASTCHGVHLYCHAKLDVLTVSSWAPSRLGDMRHKRCCHMCSHSVRQYTPLGRQFHSKADVCQSFLAQGSWWLFMLTFLLTLTIGVVVSHESAISAAVARPWLLARRLGFLTNTPCMGSPHQPAPSTPSHAHPTGLA